MHDLDILCLSETWFHEKILDTFISAEGYEVVRLDRGRKKVWWWIVKVQYSTITTTF